VVITTSTAKKYFGEVDPVGKSLEIKNKLWTVTGVIADLPDNTHYKFDILLAGLPEIRETWDHTMKDGKPISEVFWNPDVITYLLLPNNYNPQDFYSKFPKIYDLYFKESGDHLEGKNTPILEPLADIHLYSELQDGEPEGNLAYLQVFIGIGILIVILACINYMNLSTAKAVSRATEIAVKKIVGSSRRLLRWSTMLESLLLSMVSLALAVAIVYFVLDVTSFNQLIGKHLIPDFFNNPLLLWGSFTIALTVGFLSGLYPAYYLTSIPAVTALKGVFRNAKSSHVLRRTLITVQFCISIFVVVCTLFMGEQLRFVMTKDLGFESNNVLVVPLRDKVAFKNQEVVKADLLKDPRILSITGSHDIMGHGVGGGILFGESETGMVQHGGVLALFVGDDYLKTMGLELLKGRDFKPGADIDVDGIYIANEAAVKLMGWGDHPIGKKVAFWDHQNPGEIVGVVKDFNVNSLYQGIDPMVIVKGHWDTGYLQVRLSANDIPGAIEQVQKTWSKYDPNPFEYFFLDQRFNEQYMADRTQNQLLSALSYICIFISLLGLLGLSAFTATQRTKEIGVRKVLGASLSDIILLLSKNTLGLVVIAALLMAPASWWTITVWLETFVYRMPLDYTLFIIVTFSALGLVGITIAIQSLKTGIANPVKSLKYE
jgi:putative ABC transport system permease protein